MSSTQSTMSNVPTLLTLDGKVMRYEADPPGLRSCTASGSSTLLVLALPGVGTTPLQLSPPSVTVTPGGTVKSVVAAWAEGTNDAPIMATRPTTSSMAPARCVRARAPSVRRAQERAEVAPAATINNMVREMLMLGSLGQSTKGMAHQGPERRRQYGHPTAPAR